MAGYTRTDTSNNIATGNVINAADFNSEYNAIETAFNATNGHAHDGTSGGGARILKVGPSGNLTFSAGAVTPLSNNAIDLGTSGAQFKDLYIDGVAYIDAIDGDVLIGPADVDSKIQFRDSAIYIHSSADGQLDIVADTEIQIAATTVDINGNVDISGTLTIGGAGISEAELEVLDGATVSTTELNYLDGTTLGTVVASKAVAVDSNKDITGFRNVTLTGELDAATLALSGNADIDGTLEADAITVNGTALDEVIADTIGAMVTGNTESGISVTYDDSDNTLDFNVADPTITLSGDVTGSATMTNLGNVTISTTIANNSLALGTDTTGDYVATVAAGEGIDLSGSGTEGRAVTISAEIADSSNKGVASFDATDFTVSSGAVTVNAERIQDIVGAMVTGNTESGITVAYEDGDGTLDFTVGNAATATALATARTISLTGDVTGSVSFDGTGNAAITATVVDDSHNHVISNIDGLQTEIDTKAELAGSGSQAFSASTLNATTVDLGNWTVTESGGVLFFATGGTNKMKLDASGNLTVVGNVTAYGSM